MSSDGFFARVKHVHGSEVLLDVLTGLSGNSDDCCASRSFALVLLHEALLSAKDNVRGAYDTEEGRAEVRRLDAKHKSAALVQALANEGEWFVSTPWMRSNVARFITGVTLVERRNQLDPKTLDGREREIADAYDGLRTDLYAQWQPQRWARCHNYTLRVDVSDPKWAAHLEEGLEFGSAGFDVWEE